MDAQVELDEIAEVARVESGTGDEILGPGAAPEPETPDDPEDKRGAEARGRRSAMSEAERPDRMRGREITIDDIRSLAGPATPHFSLQIRNRIQKLIQGLPAGDPVRAEGEQPDRAPHRALRALRRAAGRQMKAVAESARERLSEVLDARSNALATEDSHWEHGYLDLLGEDAPDSTGVTQDLMLTRVVPVVYERWWRPTLAWAAKGLTGPGMAEEVRIARLFLGLSHGDKVLDVACGPANFSRAFAHAAGDDGLVVGIDASHTMLARGAEDTRKAGSRQPRAGPRRRYRASLRGFELRLRLLLCGASSLRRAVRRDRRDAPRPCSRRPHRDHDLDPPAGHRPADEAGGRAPVGGMRVFEAGRDHGRTRRARIRRTSAAASPAWCSSSAAAWRTTRRLTVRRTERFEHSPLVLGDLLRLDEVRRRA